MTKLTEERIKRDAEIVEALMWVTFCVFMEICVVLIHQRPGTDA